MRKAFKGGRRGSTAEDDMTAGISDSGGQRRMDLRENNPKPRAFTLRSTAATTTPANKESSPITAAGSPPTSSKTPRAVQFVEDANAGSGRFNRSGRHNNNSFSGSNNNPNQINADDPTSGDTSSVVGGVEATPSMGGRSQKSDFGTTAEVTLAEEYFSFYTGEAHYITKCFVMECNRHWRRAVRDLGNKAPLRFHANEAIQKANSLTAGETRNILLGHSARVVDGWMGAVKSLRDRALAIVHKCLESAYMPRTQGPTSSIMFVGVEDAESFVDLEEMAYIHVWKSRREGRAFQHSLRALAQVRQDVLLPPIVATPFSIAVAFQGRFITVTWMAPLVHSKPQQIEGGILAQVEEVWRRAVGVDKEGIRVPLYAGGDGRYYGMTMDILADSNLTLTAESTLHERFEYNCRDDLVEFVRTGEGASNLAHTKNGIEDRLLPALQRKMKDIKQLLNSPPHFVSHLFHSCGVNLQLMLHVRDRFSMQVNERKDQLVSLLTIGDFSKAKMFILESIDNEVVARTLKSLILGAIAHATRSYVPYSRDDMLEVILRCANSTITGFLRSVKFIKNILLPAIQKKFIKAPDFVLDMDKLHIMRIFKHLEERLGLTFDPQEKKFVQADIKPFYLSCSGRKPIPYCPLNDASVVALEFLAAQKSWRKGQPMVRRMLATLMAVSVSATGINLSIDGCFTIFTESLCDVLSRHEREQKRYFGMVGGSTVAGSRTAGGRGDTASAAYSGTLGSAGDVIGNGGVAPHLLMIGIMGEIVQSESPAVTASELEYLCRIRVLEFADKMFVAERCQQLFSFFSSPKGMITVRLDDTDTRVKVLSLWGRSIMRGIENVAHQPEIGKAMDPKKMYERVLGKYPLPTATNLETFLSLITEDDHMQAISQAPPEVRSDIIRAFVAATIVVKTSTSERCARVIISFSDAIYDDIFEELHPTLADSLCALHDELPRSSAMAFMIALIVAPSLMHHPGSARLAMEIGSLIRQLKLAKRLLLPEELDIFHIVSQGKILHQTVLNCAEGKERAEDEALYKHVLEQEDGTDTRRKLLDEEGEDDGEGAEDEAGDDGQSEVYSVSTQMMVSSRPPGHFLVAKWLGEFLERPECLELLERHRIELSYQQFTMVLTEEVRRNIMIDQREKELFQIREMADRQVLERSLYLKYLEESDAFLRYQIVGGYELRFRCVLHEFHNRTLYRLTRHHEFQLMILRILNIVCQQKIAERVFRQEAEARLRREGKYLLSLLEVVEHAHRIVTVQQENSERRRVLFPQHGEAMLTDDFGWRWQAQTHWLASIISMKHFEVSQRIQREAFTGLFVLYERATRNELARRLQREHTQAAETIERRLFSQSQYVESHMVLQETEERLQIMQREDTESTRSLAETYNDIRHHEIGELRRNLVLNALPFYQSQWKIFFSQWVDIHLTMERFIHVQFHESKQRAEVLLPRWQKLGRDAQAERQKSIFDQEAAARYLVMLECKMAVLVLDEWKGRYINIVVKENDTCRLRLQAYHNKMQASNRSERAQRLFAEEAQARRQLVATMRPLTANPAIGVQLQWIAFCSLEDIKRQERRHFAAILSVLGIEEVVGFRQPEHHDGARQTTQRRWRLTEAEAELRKAFEGDEALSRFTLDEQHARLQHRSDELFERQEWWYLYRDTTLLVLQDEELRLSIQQHAPLRRPPTSASDYYASSPSGRTPHPPASSVSRPQQTPLEASGYRRYVGSASPYPPATSVAQTPSPLTHRDLASSGNAAPQSLTSPRQPATSRPLSMAGSRGGSGASHANDASATTYMTHLLSKFDAGYFERSASGRGTRPPQLQQATSVARRESGSGIAGSSPMFPSIHAHRTTPPGETIATEHTW
ncbi:Hypothetical protein, putative [Bodo saltans]|uniref:Uncharacterized protein n=1 Tax=Bodo saltans TaxID=75058 RepID=A0A0S4JHR6_BODSA|nr:Hypothetical protein, putative [Bodo saltans]|eukprot:CUG87935.1 Hypothetical protein, putative [Bodo saltans]